MLCCRRGLVVDDDDDDDEGSFSSASFTGIPLLHGCWRKSGGMVEGEIMNVEG